MTVGTEAKPRGESAHGAGAEALEGIFRGVLRAKKGELAALLQRGTVRYEGGELPFKHKTFGAAPPDGYMLFIGLHDGEGEHADEQLWREHFDKHSFPAGSLWVAPRAPSGTGPLWHPRGSRAAVEELIVQFVLTGEVNADKVYLLGCGVGGRGVCALAPILACRLAGAMSVCGLGCSLLLNARNVPLYICSDDSCDPAAHQRSVWCYKRQTEAFKALDPDGFDFRFEKLVGGEEACRGQRLALLEKLATESRNSFPARLIWHFGESPPPRVYYWIAVPAEHCHPGALVFAARTGPNEFRLHSPNVSEVELRFNSQMLDFELPVRIFFNNELVFESLLEGDSNVLLKTVEELHDPTLTFSAEKSVKVAGAKAALRH